MILLSKTAVDLKKLPHFFVAIIWDLFDNQQEMKLNFLVIVKRQNPIFDYKLHGIVYYKKTPHQ
jgi:hypothetical protein